MEPVVPFATDCPVCGAGAATGLVVATQSAYGTDLSCGCCGLYMWQGIIGDRGADLEPAEVIERVLALVPDLPAAAAYREPWERRFTFELVPSPAYRLERAAGEGSR